LEALIIILEVLLISWLVSFFFFAINKKSEKQFFIYLFLSILGAIVTNIILFSIFPFLSHVLYFFIGSVLFSFLWYSFDRE